MPLPFKFSKGAGAVYRQLYAAVKKQYPRATSEQIQKAVLNQMGKAGYQVYQNVVYSPDEIRAIAAKMQTKQAAAQRRNPPPARRAAFGTNGPGIYAMGRRIL